MPKGTPKVKPRRLKGDGSIRDLGNGKCKITITVPSSSGSQKRINRTVPKADAVKTRDALKKAANEQALVVSSAETLSNLADSWVLAKKKSVRAGTYKNYKSIVENHLKPYFKDKKVQKITVDDLNDYFSSVFEDLEAGSVLQHRSAISGIFSKAIASGIVAVNPLSKIDRIKDNPEEIHPFTQTQAQDLLAYTKNLEDIKLYCFCLLGLSSGMRKGEMLAAIGSELEDKAITVNHTLSRDGGKLQCGPTKTPSSRRRLSMDPEVVKELRDLLKVEDGLPLFRTPSGYFWDPANVQEQFKAAVKAIGIPNARIHDMRHTHATQLIGSNMDIKTVAKRLGHSNVKLTLNLYAHWLPEKDQEAAEVMGKWLKKVGANEELMTQN